MWQTYLRPTTLLDALDLLQKYQGQARIIAGGTDVVLELERGEKSASTLIDITALSDLKYIRLEHGTLYLGALTTHNDVMRSQLCAQYALPLVQACGGVASPQIRARATVVGNLTTAVPISNTITPLMAMGAELVLVSRSGERIVSLHDFYPAIRQTICRPDELIREIRFPALAVEQHGIFLKLGLRRAFTRSIVSATCVLTFAEDGLVSDAKITLGSLVPTIIHARQAEAHLIGKVLTIAACNEAGQLACQDVHPIDDIRASASYRLTTLAMIVSQGLQTLAENMSQSNLIPPKPGRDLIYRVRDTSGDDAEDDGVSDAINQVPTGLNAIRQVPTGLDVIDTTINGQAYHLVDAQRKTLLNMIREDIGLMGTKEGCGEGECGSCTIWLNGQAVLSCITPAPQAHGATITTIEGLADGDELHPLQQAFIDHGAVQCGFCIPGMLMAGAKLLEEHPNADKEQICTALSGNICRCTGYRKIIDAIVSVRER